MYRYRLPTHEHFSRYKYRTGRLWISGALMLLVGELKEVTVLELGMQLAYTFTNHV